MTAIAVEEAGFDDCVEVVVEGAEEVEVVLMTADIEVEDTEREDEVEEEGASSS